MPHHLRLFVFIGLLFAASSSHLAKAGDLPADERTKIETLLTQVASLKDATFIRNGSSYSAKDAAKFIRSKWQSHEAEIHSAGEFIEKAASFSSTSGKPYIIKLGDGTECQCGEYLKGRLKALN